MDVNWTLPFRQWVAKVRGVAAVLEAEGGSLCSAKRTFRVHQAQSDGLLVLYRPLRACTCPSFEFVVV